MNCPRFKRSAALLSRYPPPTLYRIFPPSGLRSLLFGSGKKVLEVNNSALGGGQITREFIDLRSIELLRDAILCILRCDICRSTSPKKGADTIQAPTFRLPHLALQHISKLLQPSGFPQCRVKCVREGQGVFLCLRECHALRDQGSLCFRQESSCQGLGLGHLISHELQGIDRGPSECEHHRRVIN